MFVIYRLCGIPSTNPSPVYQEDKGALNNLCLKSFVGAFSGIKPRIHFLCDFCPDSYREMIKSIVPSDWEVSIEFTTIGINETMLRSYEIARNQDDDVLFQECDYVYVPNSGKTLLDGLNELGLVSPYDHLNFYEDKTLHSPHVTLRLVNDHHWRSTERNTMTFAIKNKIFKEYYSIFKHYGYLDGDVWYDMLSKGHMLWVPIPSLATHMVRDWMAPSVDWYSLWDKLSI